MSPRQQGRGRLSRGARLAGPAPDRRYCAASSATHPPTEGTPHHEHCRRRDREGRLPPGPDAVPPAMLCGRPLARREVRRDHRRGESGGWPGDRYRAGVLRRRDPRRDRGREPGLPRLARQDRQGARPNLAQMVRPDDGEPGGPRHHHDRRTGEAHGGNRGARSAMAAPSSSGSPRRASALTAMSFRRT